MKLTILAMALIGTMLPASAFAQEKRYCIDFIGRGHLKSVGEPEPLNIPDDVIGHSLYRLSFDKREELHGHMPWQSTVLIKSDHALMPVDAPDVIVYIASRGRRTEFFGGDPVWIDVSGRAFIPIFDWPDPDALIRWIPLSIRQFAKPVDYADDQRSGDVSFDPDDAVPGLIETRNGRTRVLFGLYLDDIPKMMKAARREPCQRN